MLQVLIAADTLIATVQFLQKTNRIRRSCHNYRCLPLSTVPECIESLPILLINEELVSRDDCQIPVLPGLQIPGGGCHIFTQPRYRFSNQSQVPSYSIFKHSCSQCLLLQGFSFLSGPLSMCLKFLFNEKLCTFLLHKVKAGLFLCHQTH